MKKIYLLEVVTLVAAIGFSGFALHAMAFDTDAIQKGQAPLAGEFKKLDIDGNDKLTHAEAVKDKLFTSRHFAKADVDHDGTLDQTEYANYKSASQKKVAGVAVKDSVITTKAKAEILATKGLKSLQISVETHKGEVILSGFVDSEASKAKAEEVVSKIKGVKSVKNSLEIRA